MVAGAGAGVGVGAGAGEDKRNAHKEVREIYFEMAEHLKLLKHSGMITDYIIRRAESLGKGEGNER